MNRPTVVAPASPTAPAGQRCVVCHAPAEIDGEIRQLPCGHHAMRTPEGAVLGWVNTGAMTLNLARASGCSESMAVRFEEHAAGIQRWREKTAERIAAAGD